LYSPRVVIERRKRMLGCNKKHDAYSWHKYIQDCMNFFRSSLFFSFYLTKHRSSDFFLFASSLSPSSRERISLQYTMPWQRRYVSMYMCSVSRERWCCPSYSFTHSFIQSLIDSHLVDLLFFYYRYPFISLHVQTWLYHISENDRRKKERKPKTIIHSRLRRQTY
jgi:hypothetical protein